MKKQYVSEAVIRRLPRYYRYLDDLHNKGVVRISSNSLGSKMGITASQIRQDLSCFGEFGQQGYGYNVKELRTEIGRILGVDQRHTVIVVGVGNLGHALMQNFHFSHNGFLLKAAFDISPAVVGTEINGVPVRSMEELDDYCREHTPLPGWMNHTPTYTAWWLVILYDYFLQNNNLPYLEAQKDYIKGVLELISTLVREDGSLIEDERCLFDWPSHGSEDEKIGILALLTLAARKAEKLFEILGLDRAPCGQLLQKLSKTNAAKVQTFKQCAAFQAYAGIRPAAEVADFLTREGAKGFSTFLSYYILSAVSDAGRTEEAVRLMKEYYGGMLDMGATSFWEDFDLDWMKGSAPIDRLPKAGEKDIHGDFGKHCYVGFRHSLCHGWSCGPVSFLIKKLGGIEPLEPGCKTVRVSPREAGLDWYEIRYPTPYGLIEISRKGDQTEIRAPKEIRIVR